MKPVALEGRIEAHNCQTLGLRLDSAEEIGLFRYDEPVAGKPIRRFTDYPRALLAALMKVQENKHLHSDDWQRTLYINTLDVGTTEFDITPERKAALIEQGIAGAPACCSSWTLSPCPGERMSDR